jgi:RHS repeat-associated protein
MVSTLTADGMRIEKVTGLSLETVESEEESSGFYDEIWSTNKPTTRYFYDGQLCVEDDQRIQMGSEWDPDVIVTRYGIGARGIDFIGYTEAEQPEVVSFPIYDGHGNMVATVKRDGTGFTCGDRRAYDAWGNIRQQTHSGYPEQRYCANLGHREDGESGLTYMRARFYEPWTGRFVSEDPKLQGSNWFMYARNCPTAYADSSGKEAVATTVDFYTWAQNFFAGLGIYLPDLPRSAQIVANTIATVEMFAGFSEALGFAATVTGGATVSTMWMMGTSFAWVPAMLHLGTQALRFAAILCKVIALATFAQCALLLYIDAVDSGMF